MSSYILPSKYLSIGYNPKNGQKFFDLLMEYYYWIRDYFISFTDGMEEEHRYNTEKMIEEMKSINTYNIPANLLFNSLNNKDKESIELIPVIRDIINLKAVTFLNPKLCKECKELYPDLETHVSIRYFDFNYKFYHNSINELFDNLVNEGLMEYIDVINVSGAYNFGDSQEFNEKCHKYNVKTKFIVNEGCLVGRTENMCFFHEGMKCTDNHNGDSNNFPCNVLINEAPWMKLASVKLFKEMIPMTNYDILKVSSRNLDITELRKILMYVTSDETRTEYVKDEKIKDYNAFLEYCKFKTSNCKCNCSECMKCKEFYEKIFKK